MPATLRAIFVSVLLLATASAAWATTFPLRINDGGSYLVDADDRPFLLHGDTAWSLIAELTREEVEVYLADRRSRGFNTLVVSLIEHKFASNAPANAYGNLPFAEGRPFEPNDAFFDHARWVLSRAREEGFVVLLTPAYLGFGGRRRLVCADAGCRHGETRSLRPVSGRAFSWARQHHMATRR
ncbi:DUF4038 domain-containing protein [Mesorhizobium sediminum]|nr:DUF4038 domain-containing protein [Mesorhizobium sediminum]